MSENEIKVNELSITIQRGQHNKENPYVMISKKMLRDKCLSIREKGALSYLLSLPDNWVTHPRQVAEALGVSKNQIYSILKNLIIAGYATKTQNKSNEGRFTSVSYCFYEEKLETPQVIKEKSTVSQNPETDNPYTEKGTLLNTYDKENIHERDNSSLKVPLTSEEVNLLEAKASENENLDSSNKKPKRIRAPSDFSPKVKEVGDKMINALVRSKPNYVPPRNLTAFLTHIDYLLRLDNRDVQLVIDVFSWALADAFWCDKMYKPNPAEYLRKQFDQLEMKMKVKPLQKERKFSPSSNDARALEKMLEWEKDAL